MRNLSEDKLQQLEYDLNKIFFNGIPIGSTLVNYLQIVFLIGQSNPGKLTILKEWARSIYINYIGIHFVRKKRRTLPEGLKRGLPLLTFISERSHLFKINYTIWQYGTKDQFNCLLKDHSLFSLFEEKTQSLLWNELPFPGLTIWRKAFGNIKKPLRQIITAFVKENHLPTMFITQIMNELAVQTQYILAYELLLDQLKPKYILSEYDRNGLCAGLMLVAKKRGIPTYSHMHGVVNHRFGYLPLLADYLFCWGERQKQLLIEKGADPGRLIVSGATQLSNQVKADPQQARAKLDLDFEQKIVLLATNPINDKYRFELTKIFCEAIHGIAEFKGVVRLHPSEDIGFYQKFIDEYSDILFDKNDVFLFEESFAVADMVCIFNSAYGIDALIKNIPVMIINLDDDNLGQAKDLIQKGGFPSARNGNELRKLILHFFNNEETHKLFLERQKNYSEMYCQAFGEEAAENIINSIQQQISTRIAVYE